MRAGKGLNRFPSTPNRKDRVMAEISDQDKIAFADAVLASTEAAAVAAARDSGERQTNRQNVSLTFEVTFKDSPIDAKPWEPIVCCTCIRDPFGDKRCTGDCC